MSIDMCLHVLICNNILIMAFLALLILKLKQDKFIINEITLADTIVYLLFEVNATNIFY